MGFLGLGNYAKPGKGVKKGGSDKKRFFQFFELYFRKFSKLIKLNLLYVLFCLPSIVIGILAVYFVGTLSGGSGLFTIVASIVGIIALGFTGPATAAMMKIARYFSEEKPVFLVSDFFAAFKENFKQALIVGLINSTLAYVIFHSFTFYYAKAMITSIWYWIPLGLIIFITVVVIMSNFYIFLAMVSVNLNLKSLIKNAVSLGFLGAKTNFITLFFVILVLVPSFLYVPLTIPLLLLLTFSTASLIVAFNSFQYIYKYCIRPYYVLNNLEDPYEENEDEEDSIFEDNML